jgi:competence protein ComFB
MNRKNYTEKMVEEVLEEIFKSYPEYAGIRPYKEEIIALALSKCEPFYTTSDVGHAVVKTRMDSSGFRSKVTAVVMEAIDKVKDNPREKD